ncbi:MAG: peptidase M50 [Gammaproteobacteria bacterium SG8_47]|nr:MAG: peptidase M50 [Gammaproteobacteria bacterium SG8_47]
MTPRQYPLFELFGFQVRVDVSWFLIALLITWTLAAGLFPQSYPGLSPDTYWWMGLTGAAGVFVSIVFHEFCHSFVARQFAMPIRGITLFIFGGIAEMEKEPPTPKAEFLMAIAGPLGSLLLAAVFHRLNALATSFEWPTFIVGVTYYLSYLNTVLAVFNLVPAFPLDGGRMLRAALWAWKKNLTAATRVASQIGAGFGLVLMGLGLLAVLQGLFIVGMWWFLIGMFLRATAAASYKQVLAQQTLQDQPVRRFMSREPVSVDPSISIEQLVQDFVYRHHFKLFPVVEDTRLLGCITTADIKRVPREQWHVRAVGELTHPCSNANTVSPEVHAMTVLTSMSRPGAPNRFMVVENQRLVGIISLTDLKEFIALKLELEAPD